MNKAYPHLVPDPGRRDYDPGKSLFISAQDGLRLHVREYGDPRNPKVDPIDWIERIPISETRNYVQRIIENMQVYRTRFGNDPRLLIEADLRRGG